MTADPRQFRDWRVDRRQPSADFTSSSPWASEVDVLGTNLRLGFIWILPWLGSVWIRRGLGWFGIHPARAALGSYLLRCVRLCAQALRGFTKYSGAIEAGSLTHGRNFFQHSVYSRRRGGRRCAPRGLPLQIDQLTSDWLPGQVLM
jgi:hypothetical protein